MTHRHITSKFRLALVIWTVALGLQVGVAGAGHRVSGWSIQPSPNPAGATSSTLAAVACSGDGTCSAVGQYSMAGNTFPLAERWDGSRWTIDPTPHPARASVSLLTGVSCAGPQSCMAVGLTVTTRSAIRALVEQWNGIAWAIVPTPRPLKALYVALQAVSCPASNACTAVGGYVKKRVDAQSQPLAERWDGSGWTIEPAPNPHAENGSWLSGVSCANTGACEVVGNYAYGDVDQSVFAFGWNGTSWIRQHQPNPGGQALNTDNSVSCSGATACTSIGTWTDSGGRTRGLAEYWDGSSWARQRVPDPSGFAISELFGVSCVGGTACTAVGDWSASPNGIPSSTLGERWDGTAWSIQSTPNPAGATLSTLHGVHCTSPGVCVAVGSSYAAGVTQTLVEGYSG